MLKQLQGETTKGRWPVTPAWHFYWGPRLHFESPRKFRLAGKISQRESLVTRRSGKMAHRIEIRAPTMAFLHSNESVLINRPSQAHGNLLWAQKHFPIIYLAFSLVKLQFFLPWKAKHFCVCVCECSVLFGTINEEGEGKWKAGLRASAVKSFCMFFGWTREAKIPQTLLPAMIKRNTSQPNAYNPTAELMQHAKMKQKEAKAKSCKEHTEKYRKEEDKKWFSWNLFRSSRNFLFYLFGERRWSWFCFQLCSKRWSHQRLEKEKMPEKRKPNNQVIVEIWKEFSFFFEKMWKMKRNFEKNCLKMMKSWKSFHVKRT